MVNYNYKVKFEFLKERKDKKIKLEECGFDRYSNEEAENEVLYAKHIKVNPECFIVRGLVADLNNPDWQQAANINHWKRKQALKDAGLEWEKQEDGTFKVIETEEMISEFSEAFLCVNANPKVQFPYGILLLKGADGIFRGGSETLQKCCPEAIKELLDAGIIYKVKAGYKPDPKPEKTEEAEIVAEA